MKVRYIKRKFVVCLLLGVTLLILILISPPTRIWIERAVLSVLGSDSNYIASGHSATLEPSYQGADQHRDRVKVGLTEVARGLKYPVDVQFAPHQPHLMLVAEKAGRVIWVNTHKPQERGVFLAEEATVSQVEQGLLGIAFHPQFVDNGRLFISATVALPDGREVSQIAEWRVTPSEDFERAQPRKTRVVLEVEQPYQNHNGGQIAFGLDGHLYIGLGDGGLAHDPRGHGQNTRSLLGAMLRVDIDAPRQSARGYEIPTDNPFRDDARFAPEIWAYGLRNPWRYSFAPDGRLIVADVGQSTLEEVAIVNAGENHGWNIREGDRCFSPESDCPTEGLTDPIYTYTHSEGTSITGGYVYRGSTIKALYGRYIFGDFTSGRIWALTLPALGSDVTRSPAQLTATQTTATQPTATQPTATQLTATQLTATQLTATRAVKTLGKWPLLISTFGRDAYGEVYVADFARGRIFKITSTP